MKDLPLMNKIGAVIFAIIIVLIVSLIYAIALGLVDVQRI